MKFTKHLRKNHILCTIFLYKTAGEGIRNQPNKGGSDIWKIVC